MENLNVIKYYGSKAVNGNRLMEHFDYNTKVYIEMFGGGASILLNKPEHHIEIYNELDKGVYTLFKVLKNREGCRILQEHLLDTPCERNVFNESLYIREKYTTNKPYDKVISGMDRYVKDVEKKYGYNLCKQYKKSGAGSEEIYKKIKNIGISYKEYENAVKKMEDYNKAVNQYIPEEDVYKIKNGTLDITRNIKGEEEALSFEKLLSRITTVSVAVKCKDKLLEVHEELQEKICNASDNTERQNLIDMSAMSVNIIYKVHQMLCRLQLPVHEEKIPEGSPGTVSNEEIELAKATFITFNMSRDGIGKEFSTKEGLWGNFRKKAESLPYIEQRLKNVTVTNYDCFTVLEDIKKTFHLECYEDEEIFIYLDPPYLQAAGSSSKDKNYNPGMVYKHGFGYDDHKRLLGLVQSLPFKAAVSNYRDNNSVYDSYLNEENGWHSLEFETFTPVGGVARDRTEVLWMNY